MKIEAIRVIEFSMCFVYACVLLMLVCRFEATIRYLFVWPGKMRPGLVYFCVFGLGLASKARNAPDFLMAAIVIAVAPSRRHIPAKSSAKIYFDSLSLDKVLRIGFLLSTRIVCIFCLT